MSNALIFLAVIVGGSTHLHDIRVNHGGNHVQAGRQGQEMSSAGTITIMAIIIIAIIAEFAFLLYNIIGSLIYAITDFIARKRYEKWREERDERLSA